MNTHLFLIKKILLLALICTGTLHAQTFEQPLVKWNNENPIQKLYLHIDREHYFSGQTIWFKSYFLSDFMPSAANSTLFVELLNNQSGIISKKVLPVFGALSNGQMQIPDTLSTGSYQLRAYTPLMLNHSKEYLFSRRVQIYGKERKGPAPAAPATVTNIRFFAEGGNLVAGVPNNVAFKSVDENGFPFTVRGIVKDDAGNEVARFTTLHDGMGAFSFTPQAGKNYYAGLVHEPDVKHNLPEVTTNGIALQLRQAANGVEISLQNPGGGEALAPAYMIGQMQHQILFKHAFINSKNNMTAQVPTAKFPSGILQITVFNKDGVPLAERLAFVDNKEYLLPATFNANVVNTSRRKLNDYTIHLSDSVTGNFSISVTDADYDSPGMRAQNIISSFLLTSDIAGYVHNPAWYFSDAENTRQALDLVMMTNGWRRFKWSDVTSNNLPVPQHKDQGYISLSGRAKVRGSGRSFADRELMVWTATADSAQGMQLVKTDAEGRFKMDSVIFFDKAKVLFTDVMGNKSKFITVELDTDSLYKTYNLPPLNIPYNKFNTTADHLAQRMGTAYFDYSRGEGLMLDNIIVKGNKTRLEQLEEIYMSGFFAGGINARTYDLTNEFIPHWNIFEYLQGRVPGLRVERSTMNDYRLYYRQVGTFRPMYVYLDEMLVDASFVSTIPASDIALVKIFPTFVAAPGGGANGVIAVYTKRGHELNEHIESTGDIVDYDGYSIIKEFYAPDYSQPVPGRYTDYRLTLDWKPEVYVSGTNQKIPVTFYNNDRTKRFRVVAEGITGDGKLLMVEEIVEAR